MVADEMVDGIRIIVINGSVGVLCAYVGVPENDPRAGFDCDDVELDCHGGLTFSDRDDDEYRPSGYWWYGWDYAHSGDYPFGSHVWTTEAVLAEARDVARQFSQLTVATRTPLKYLARGGQ